MSEPAVETIGRMRRRIGAWGIGEVLLSPVLTPLLIIPAWLRSLWLARRLLDGQWHRYRGFTPLNALNSFFYPNQWLNISRFGIHGRSPLVGLGDYPLSRWFHVSFLSSCLYAHAGAVCTLGGTLAWVAMHAAWTGIAGVPWTLAVVAALLFSSTAYAMAYTRQNYNILGWLWLPLVLSALLGGEWGVAAAAALAASFASITVVFVLVPIVLVLSVLQASGAPLAALVPALAKLALHLEPLVRQRSSTSSFGAMARIIGASSRGVQYRRTSMGLRPFTVYFLLVYAVACALLHVDHGLPWLPLTALALFAINQIRLRFADEQSLILLFVSAVAADVLSAPPSMLGFAALLVAANPLPVFLSLCDFEADRTLVRPRTFAPFDHEPLRIGIEAFLAPVPPGATVLFAFEDPQGVYERVFDGQRSLLELPLFVAATRGVHLFPDWHAIAETNRVGAPSWWGRSPDDVMRHAADVRASHAIVYTDSGEPIPAAWAERGFTVCATFDWATCRAELRGDALWRRDRPPCWWLMSVPATPGSSRGAPPGDGP
ncbi:MAG TPA: hypothetical protein VMU47_00345 [Caldimonas sp.]|nr:hypothetical protein [Caldimonas sp.]